MRHRSCLSAFRFRTTSDWRKGANGFSESPTAQDTLALWSGQLGLSRRTLTRLFRHETGLTFSAWQRRAILHAALPRLLGGERVTTIAYDLGYASPAGF